jgi:hypothetical protein
VPTGCTLQSASAWPGDDPAQGVTMNTEPASVLHRFVSLANDFALGWMRERPLKPPVQNFGVRLIWRCITCLPVERPRGRCAEAGGLVARRCRPTNTASCSAAMIQWLEVGMQARSVRSPATKQRARPHRCHRQAARGRRRPSLSMPVTADAGRSKTELREHAGCGASYEGPITRCPPKRRRMS